MIRNVSVACLSALMLMGCGPMAKGPDIEAAKADMATFCAGPTPTFTLSECQCAVGRLAVTMQPDAFLRLHEDYKKAWMETAYGVNPYPQQLKEQLTTCAKK